MSCAEHRGPRTVLVFIRADTFGVEPQRCCILGHAEWVQARIPHDGSRSAVPAIAIMRLLPMPFLSSRGPSACRDAAALLRACSG